MITSKVTSSIIFTRLITGLIMMAYCFGHMINHSLGIISVETMDFFRQYFMAFWRAPGIYWLMPISILLHAGAALFTFLHRRSLHGLTITEKVQFGLGLVFPFLLFIHISYGRIGYHVNGRPLYYSNFFHTIEEDGILVFFLIAYSLLLGMVWGHGCIGLHRWLSLKPWYSRFWLACYTLAIMPYITSMIGIVVGYRETSLRKSDSNWLLRLDEQAQWLTPEGTPMSSEEIDHIIMPFAFQLIGAFFVSVMLGVIIRLIWLQIEKRRSTIEVRYSDGANINDDNAENSIFLKNYGTNESLGYTLNTLNNTNFTVVPDSVLPEYSYIQIILSNIQDTNGNNFGSTTFQFRTADETPPTIASSALATSNEFVTLNFNEAIYSTDTGSGAITTNDLNPNFVGSASCSNLTMIGISNSNGNALTGGETTVRVTFTLTGPPTGDETIQFNPNDGASIFDAAGNPMSADETTNLMQLNPSARMESISLLIKSSCPTIILLIECCMSLMKLDFSSISSRIFSIS